MNYFIQERKNNKVQVLWFFCLIFTHALISILIMYYRKPETELVSRKTRKKKMLEHARFSRVSSCNHYPKFIFTRFFSSHLFILKLWFSQTKEWKSTTCYNGCVCWTLIGAFSEAVTLSCFHPTGQCMGLRDCFVPLPAALYAVITYIPASSTVRTQVAHLWQK